MGVPAATPHPTPIPTAYHSLVHILQVYEHITYGGLEHVRLATLPGMWERTLTVSSSGACALLQAAVACIWARRRHRPFDVFPILGYGAACYTAPVQSASFGSGTIAAPAPPTN